MSIIWVGIEETKITKFYLEQKEQMASGYYLTLYPYSALLLTSYCALHLLLHMGFVSAKRLVQEEVGGVTHGVLCTGLALKGPLLALGGPILTSAA